MFDVMQGEQGKTKWAPCYFVKTFLSECLHFLINLSCLCACELIHLYLVQTAMELSIYIYLKQKFGPQL